MADAMELMLLSVLSPALACEWNISAVQQASIMMVVFSGMMLSSTFWGKICDRFGRKTVRVNEVLNQRLVEGINVLNSYGLQYGRRF